MTGGIHTKWLVFMSGVILMVMSCNLQPEPAPEPEVVRKKIAVPHKLEPPKAPVAQGPLEKDSAIVQKSPVAEPKPLPPAEKKADLTISLNTTGNVQPKAGDKQAMVISETAKKKLFDKGIPLYDPAGRIDPFSPLIKKRKPESKSANKKPKKKKRIPRTPLEKMDFSQMKLVAIVRSSKGSSALVEEASGRGYVIYMGTYMGLNSGKVIEILKDRIVVEEEVENVLGEVVSKKRDLKLQKPPGEL